VPSLCENFLYGFKAARRAARAAATAASASAPAGAPAAAGQTPVGWREDLDERRAAVRTEQFPSRGKFDKGTLAAAQIGLKRACQKPARSRARVRAAAPYQIRRSVWCEADRSSYTSADI
jgi:hypothetical protein